MTASQQPITRVRVEIERGEFTQYLELHGTPDHPIDGAAALGEDGGYGTVELRLRGPLEPPADPG